MKINGRGRDQHGMLRPDGTPRFVTSHRLLFDWTYPYLAYCTL